MHFSSEVCFLGHAVSSVTVCAGDKKTRAVPNQECDRALPLHKTKFSFCHMYTKQDGLFCRMRMSQLTKSRVPHFLSGCGTVRYEMETPLFLASIQCNYRLQRNCSCNQAIHTSVTCHISNAIRDRIGESQIVSVLKQKPTSADADTMKVLMSFTVIKLSREALISIASGFNSVQIFDFLVKKL